MLHRTTVKTSTIFVSTGGKTRVFRSLTDIPPNLRRRLEESTNGFNSATILIADRKGREEIVRALNGLPSSLRARLASSLGPKREPEPEVVPTTSRRFLSKLRNNWLELTLPPLVGLAVWLAFQFR